MTAGQVVFHPAGSPHATLWRAGGVGFALQIGAAKAAALAGLGALPGRPVVTPNAGPLTGLMLAARAALHRPDGAAATDAEALLAEAMAELAGSPAARAEAGAPRWLRTARDAFSDAFADPPALDEVAAAAGVHPAHLSRAFRRHFGETAGDCVRRRRIESACRRIAEDAGASLTEVAAEAGFADQAHFTRTFRRQVGMPPSEYARRVRRSFPGC